MLHGCTDNYARKIVVAEAAITSNYWTVSKASGFGQETQNFVLQLNVGAAKH